MSLQSSVARLAHQVHLPDDTLTLKLDGYAFIGHRCRELGTDVFETRILLQRTVCMLGADAARCFYDGERIQRDGAAPMRVQATLFGRGGVQSLDGAAHHVRKQMFMQLLAPANVRRLCELFETSLLSALPRWADRAVLFDEAQDALCRAACAWAGITLDDERRIRDLAAMIDGGGGAGPRNWRGRVGRARAEWWVEKQIEQVRSGVLPGIGALGVFANSDLEARIAAIELLNMIRPTVAVARYVTFAALALHEYPHTEDLVHDESTLDPFVHEVRRFFPFFPAVVGRARRTFTFHDVEIREGDRVMLDLYGTNHDPRVWERPDEFHPERFIGRAIDPYTLIPQGGGDTPTGHRCPGEALTIELIKSSVRFLTRRISYEVPPQDLSISLSRIPAQPASRFVITNARAR